MKFYYNTLILTRRDIVLGKTNVLKTVLKTTFFSLLLVIFIAAITFLFLLPNGLVSEDTVQYYLIHTIPVLFTAVIVYAIAMWVNRKKLNRLDLDDDVLPYDIYSEGLDSLLIYEEGYDAFLELVIPDEWEFIEELELLNDSSLDYVVDKSKRYADIWAKKQKALEAKNRRKKNKKKKAKTEEYREPILYHDGSAGNRNTGLTGFPFAVDTDVVGDERIKPNWLNVQDDADAAFELLNKPSKDDEGRKAPISRYEDDEIYDEEISELGDPIYFYDEPVFAKPVSSLPDDVNINLDRQNVSEMIDDYRSIDSWEPEEVFMVAQDSSSDEFSDELADEDEWVEANNKDDEDADNKNVIVLREPEPSEPEQENNDIHMQPEDESLEDFDKTVDDLDISQEPVFEIVSNDKDEDFITESVAESLPFEESVNQDDEEDDEIELIIDYGDDEYELEDGQDEESAEGKDSLDALEDNLESNGLMLDVGEDENTSAGEGVNPPYFYEDTVGASDKNGLVIPFVLYEDTLDDNIEDIEDRGDVEPEYKIPFDFISDNLFTFETPQIEEYKIFLFKDASVAFNSLKDPSVEPFPDLNFTSDQSEDYADLYDIDDSYNSDDFSDFDTLYYDLLSGNNDAYPYGIDEADRKRYRDSYNDPNNLKNYDFGSNSFLNGILNDGYPFEKWWEDFDYTIGAGAGGFLLSMSPLHAPDFKWHPDTLESFKVCGANRDNVEPNGLIPFVLIDENNVQGGTQRESSVPSQDDRVVNNKSGSRYAVPFVLYEELETRFIENNYRSEYIKPESIVPFKIILDSYLFEVPEVEDYKIFLFRDGSRGYSGEEEKSVEPFPDMNFLSSQSEDYYELPDISEFYDNEDNFFDILDIDNFVNSNNRKHGYDDEYNKKRGSDLNFGDFDNSNKANAFSYNEQDKWWEDFDYSIGSSYRGSAFMSPIHIPPFVLYPDTIGAEKEYIENRDGIGPNSLIQFVLRDAGDDYKNSLFSDYAEDLSTYTTDTETQAEAEDEEDDYYKAFEEIEDKVVEEFPDIEFETDESNDYSPYSEANEAYDNSSSFVDASLSYSPTSDSQSDKSNVNSLDGFADIQDINPQSEDARQGEEVHDKWWDDFDYTLGSSYRGSAMMSPIHIPPFALYADTLKAVKEDIIRDDNISASGNVPFIFYAEKNNYSDAALGYVISNERLFDRNPNMEPYKNFLDMEGIERECGTSLSSSATFDSLSDISFSNQAFDNLSQKWWDDFYFVPGVKKINIFDTSDLVAEDVPFDAYQEEQIEDKGIDAEIVADVNADDEEEIETEVIDGVLLERDDSETLNEEQNPNNLPYALMLNDGDVPEGDWDEDEFILSKDLYGTDGNDGSSPLYKWWDDFYFIPGVKKINIFDTSDLVAEDVPFDAYQEEQIEDKGIDAEIVADVNADDEEEIETEVIDGVLLERDDSETLNEEQNPNNLPYALMLNDGDVPEGDWDEDEFILSKDLYGTDGNDGSSPLYKWWDDFTYEYIPSENEDVEKMPSTLDVSDHYNIMDMFFDLDNVSYAKSDNEDSEADKKHEDGESKQIDKWWEDFNFKPGIKNIFDVSDLVAVDVPYEAYIEKVRLNNKNNVPYSLFLNEEDVPEGDWNFDDYIFTLRNEEEDSFYKWWDDFYFVSGEKKINIFDVSDLAGVDVPYEAKLEEEIESPFTEEEIIEWEDWWSDIEKTLKKEGFDIQLEGSATPRPIRIIEYNLKSILHEEMMSSREVNYNLSIARIDSTVLDKIIESKLIDAIAFPLAKNIMCGIFLTMDKAETAEVLSHVKKVIDPQMTYKISTLNKRGIDEDEFLVEVFNEGVDNL